MPPNRPVHSPFIITERSSFFMTKLSNAKRREKEDFDLIPVVISVRASGRSPKLSNSPRGSLLKTFLSCESDIKSVTLTEF